MLYIDTSPEAIRDFLTNSYGPTWDSSMGQQKLVEWLSDDAQIEWERRRSPFALISDRDFCLLRGRSCLSVPRPAPWSFAAV